MGKSNITPRVRDAEHEDQSEEDDDSWTIEDAAEDLLSLYRFLTYAYVSEWRLRIPPASGWPQITQESFANFNKEPIAIELLRHLPYFRSDDEYVQIWVQCYCVDYASMSVQSTIQSAKNSDDLLRVECISLQTDERHEDYKKVTSHHIVIGNLSCRDGTALIFDTRDGTVIENNPMYGHWKRYDSMAALVEHIISSFRKMQVMPIDTITLTWNFNTEEPDPVRDILISHGWPKKRYKKSECLRAIQKADLSSYNDPESFEDQDEVETPSNANYRVQHVASRLKSLYQLLVRLYLPSDMLRTPPHAGWYRVYGYSRWFRPPDQKKAALELLAHLPYIRQDLQDTIPTMIDADCICVDYSGELFHHDDPSKKLIVPDDLGPDKIVLATTHDRHTPAITFNLVTGSMEKLSNNGVLLFPNMDAFTEHMTNAFLKLEIVPLDQATVQRVSSAHSLKCKEVMEKSGWPGPKYNKSQCMATLRHLQSA